MILAHAAPYNYVVNVKVVFYIGLPRSCLLRNWLYLNAHKVNSSKIASKMGMSNARKKPQSMGSPRHRTDQTILHKWRMWLHAGRSTSLLPGLNCIIAQICCVPQRSFAQAVRNTHTEPLPVDFKRRYSEFQQELKKNTKHGQSSSEKFFSTQLLPAPSPGAVVSPCILQKTVSSYSTKKEKKVLHVIAFLFGHQVGYRLQW